jgi:hypothetical protein
MDRYNDSYQKDLVGNFNHPPNYDAIGWLIKDIWPKINAELPDAELHIYGKII